MHAPEGVCSVPTGYTRVLYMLKARISGVEKGCILGADEKFALSLSLHLAGLKGIPAYPLSWIEVRPCSWYRKEVGSR